MIFITLHAGTWTKHVQSYVRAIVSLFRFFFVYVPLFFSLFFLFLFVCRAENGCTASTPFVTIYSARAVFVESNEIGSNQIEQRNSNHFVLLFWFEIHKPTLIRLDCWFGFGLQTALMIQRSINLFVSSFGRIRFGNRLGVRGSLIAIYCRFADDCCCALVVQVSRDPLIYWQHMNTRIWLVRHMQVDWCGICGGRKRIENVNSWYVAVVKPGSARECNDVHTVINWIRRPLSVFHSIRFKMQSKMNNAPRHMQLTHDWSANLPSFGNHKEK